MDTFVPTKRLRGAKNAEKKAIQFQEPDQSIPAWDDIGVNLFKTDTWNVLLKDLSEVWNFPSSYQLINRIIKHSTLTKTDFKKTSKQLEEKLVEKGFISDKENNLFYVSFEQLYSVVSNKDIFYHADDLFSHDLEDIGASSGAWGDAVPGSVTEISSKDTSQDKVTIEHVFPQYSYSIQKTHAMFNSLTNVTKLNYYRTLHDSYKYLPNDKFSFADRETIARDNDIYESYLELEDVDDLNGEPKRKKFKKTRRHNIEVDPNTIELAESLIPGQGYIQEFNVNHVCKVPNYNLVSHVQQPALPSSTANSTAAIGVTPQLGAEPSSESATPSTTVKNEVKLSKNVQQLVSNENDSYNPSKYLYSKSYRGPNTGNYKDATLLNRINNIPTTSKHISNLHKTASQLAEEGSRSRLSLNLKGLVCDEFHKSHLNTVLYWQKKNKVEDYQNLELLHNNLSFNLLVNTYRSISEETWKTYYDFKLIDFEQEYALSVEQKEVAASQKFVEDMKNWKIKESQRKEKQMMRANNQRANAERNQQMNPNHNSMAAFNDPFVNDFNLLGADLKMDTHQHDMNHDDPLDAFDIDDLTPLHPPKPVETPQLEVLNRFTLPIVYPEIYSSLPLDMRSINRSHKKDPTPAIKKVIRYISTYPDAQQPEILNKMEIIKIPNSNAIGWDNLRKFRRN